MTRNPILEAYQDLQVKPLKLPKAPDPVETQQELQEIARAHPDLADTLTRAVRLIARQSAALVDVQRVLKASRLVEDLL